MKQIVALIVVLTLGFTASLAFAHHKPWHTGGPQPTTTEPPPTTTTPPPTTTEPPPPTTTEPPPPTTTEPPPTTTTEPPPTNDCTKTLSAGGSLSTFLASLVSGDIACLREGTYSSGSNVSFSIDADSRRIVLKSWPGETATISGTEVIVSGDNLTVLNITSVNSPEDGFTVSGNNVRLEGNTILNAGRHAIITSSTSSGAVIVGNKARGMGGVGCSTPCTLHHGIYLQGFFHYVIRNAFDDCRAGYCIHIYGGSRSDPHGVVVAGNTATNSGTRSGILVDTNGSAIVVNNIAAFNRGDNGSTGFGILYRRCSSCMVDWNITWGNVSGSVGGTLATQATNTMNVDPMLLSDFMHVSPFSPAVDAGRADYAFYPDIDGQGPMGANVDIGADEQ